MNLYQRALGLMVSAAIIGWMVWERSETATPAPPPRIEVELPASQLEFCDTLESALKERRLMMTKWSEADKAKNGIVTAAISAEMRGKYRERNTRLFGQGSKENFQIHEWIASIVEIQQPIKDKVAVQLKPVCSGATAFRATLDVKHFELLRGLKAGDRVKITGRFTDGIGGPPSAADSFERSFTESGSIYEPEFDVTVDRLSR